MRLSNYTQEELQQIIGDIIQKIRAKTATEGHDYALGHIQVYVENKVIGDIKKRQEKIQGLIVDGHGLKVRWGGDLTPGCQHCIDSKSGFKAIRSVASCNLKCKFCYYHGEESFQLKSEHFSITERHISKEDIKIYIDKQGDRLDGLAWVFWEPFMDIEKHYELIEYISKRGIHQHMYTNGTLCEEDSLKKLADSGLTELRFNLAATLCSNKVLNNMKIAGKYFKYLCIESPMVKEYYESFMKNKDEILDTGVGYINCAELHLQKNNYRNYFSEDEPFYFYRRGYFSPIFSRQLTYDLMEVASSENWPVVINDCSNQLKYYRGIRRGDEFGNISYNNEVGLLDEWYYDAIKRYHPFE